MRPKKSCNTLL